MILGRRVTVAAAVAVVMGVASPTAAFAHTGGESFTSNYQTRITDVSPADTQLKVSISEIDATIELTWTGPGEVVVIGYEGEPYLRISERGVERNRRSPATYLNLDRYAAVTVPAIADATASPQWDLISTARTVRWHDHRTHWMDRVPPLQVRDNPDAVTVIYAQWQIPITVADVDGAITGTLRWVPPHSAWPIFALLAVGGLTLATLLATRRWQRVALIATMVATAVFLVDSVGYLGVARGKAFTVAWFVGWPIISLVACVWLAIAAHRRKSEPSVWLSITGIILAVIGGWDRRDVFNHSQVFTSWPDWSARSAAAICIGIGTVVAVRYVVYVLRLATEPIARLPPGPDVPTA